MKKILKILFKKQKSDKMKAHIILHENLLNIWIKNKKSKNAQIKK